MGYGLFRALLGDRAVLPPSPARDFPRTWRQRRGVGTTRLRRPRRLAFVWRKLSRPLHPTARSWRSRPAPLIGWDGRIQNSDLRGGESGIFFAAGLDTISENRKWFARRVVLSQPDRARL